MSNPFEEQLARTPRRELPPEWRSEILRTANAASRRTPEPGWWTQLWLRVPVPTLGFAAACGLTAVFSIIEPASDKSGFTTAQPLSSAQIAAARAERRELLQAFYLVDGAGDFPAESKESSAPPPPTALPRPRSDRRDAREDRFGNRASDHFQPFV